MPKTGVFEGDPSAVTTKATELRKELQRLMRVIVEDEEGFGVEAIDRATKMLCDLKDLKLGKKSISLELNEPSLGFPQEFRCPLSKELMRDPVVVATGQTYDRPFIQKWLKAGNRTCPRTEQVLSHTTLTANHLILEMISEWCKNHCIQFPEPTHYSDEDVVTEADRSLLLSLLEKLSSTVSDQKEAARSLRSLTKRMPSFRALFSESMDAIPQLLKPLVPSTSDGDVHPDLHEDLITTLLNLSIHDNNKKLVAETPMAIPILLDALVSRKMETRSNAAATLFTLSALDSNKLLIAKSGAMKPLIDLLEEGHPLAMKDVASAIFNLCIILENKARAVRDGAVRVILEKINSRAHVDELLSILAMLSTNQMAVEEMRELGAVSSLFSVMRESACPRNNENCIAILYSICYNDRTTWKEMREEEKNFCTLSKIAEKGTSRARRKANGILERINRGVNLTHTA